MANIVQRITLQGAEEIRAQLRALGAAGKAAFDDLSNARTLNDRFASAGLELSKLTGSLKTFGQNAAQAGQAGVAFGNAIQSAFARVAVAAGALGLAFGKIISQVKSVGADAEVLDQNAAAVGLTTKEYEGLTLALGQNGVSSQEAAKALDKIAKFMAAAKDQTDAYKKEVKKLNKEQLEGKIGAKEYNERLKDINDNMGPAAKLVKEYGLRLTDAAGELRSVKDFGLDFGDALKNSGKATKDNAAALEVMGKAGRKLGQAFGQGKEQLEALISRAQALAPSLTEEAQKAVTGMDDAFDQLGQTGNSLKRNLVAIFAPSITAAVTAFTEAIARNRFIFELFAENLDRQFRPALVAVLNQLNSTDFSVTLQKGLDAATEAVKAFGVAVKTFIIPTLLGIKIFADQVAQGLNKVFGTNLTGGAVIFGAILLKVSGLLNVFTTGITFTVLSVKALISVLPVLGQAFNVLFTLLRANPIIALAVVIGVLVGLILRQFPQLRDAIFNFLVNPLEGVKAAWNGLVQFFTTFIQNLINIWNAVAGFFVGLWTGITDGAKAVWDGVTGAANAAVEALKAVWNGLVQFFVDLWTGITSTFDTAWQAIKDGAQSVWDFIVQSVSAPFQKIKDVVNDMWSFVKQKFEDLIKTVKDFLGLSAQADASGGGSPQSNASGGYIRGRGTGTSDSILSWLSNGEFVIKARAVKHYGAGFLSALNNMRLPKFASGGSVNLASMAHSLFSPEIPRFAAGGPVISQGTGGGGDARSMVLQIGDQLIPGLTATPAAVTQIQRFASQSAVRSAGRKPVWFKG